MSTLRNADLPMINKLIHVFQGGLLAAAIHNMDGIGGKPGWAWIFILEGLFTVLCAAVSFFILEDFPESAKFLSETERASLSICVHYDSNLTEVGLLILGVWVIRRLQADLKHSAGGESFKMKYVWQSLKDWKTWLASEFNQSMTARSSLNADN